MHRLALALAAAALAFTAAAAAAPGRPLDAAEARKTFFGVDMSGVMKGEAGDVAWRECVDPAGATVYWFAGAMDRGRMRVREDGALCFAYESSGFAEEGCFAAYAEGKDQHRFVGLDGDSTFLTRRLRKGVKACSASEMVS